MKLCFVTVGTTSFESLIHCIDSAEFEQVLLSKGFTHLRIQIGKGEYIPNQHFACAYETYETEPDSLNNNAMDRKMVCEYYRFKPTLQKDLSLADLIIGHAG